MKKCLNSLIKNAGLVYAVSILFVFSCSSGVKESEGKFEPEDVKLTEFQSKRLQIVNIETDSLETVPYGNDRAFRYCFKGDLLNNSENIFKSARIKLRINLVLDNGNVITNEDIDKVPLLIDRTMDIISDQWLSHEVKRCAVFSPRIQSAYAHYPVKKATINLIVIAEDQINNEEVGGVFRTTDITDIWKREAEKMKKTTTEYDLNLKREEKSKKQRLKSMPSYIYNG